MATPKSKKFKKFLDEKVSAKRAKVLAQIIDSTPESEYKPFFVENHAVILSVLKERFADFESTKAKHTTQQDLDALLSVFQEFAHGCVLNQRTEAMPDIERMIRLTLHQANKHAIRRRGFEVLLGLLHAQANRDAVPNAQDPLVLLLGQVLNLRPFRSVCRAPNLHETESSMSAATTPPSKEEALDMLQLFMDFSISRERTFQYFFELFKITYLPCLYADVSKELGLELSDYQKEPFPFCPPEIQRVMIQTVDRWVASPVISKTVWTKQSGHGRVMMELLRQACRVPLEFHEDTIRAIDLYHHILIAQKSKAIPTVLGGPEQIQLYWQSYIVHLTSVFDLYSDSSLVATHVVLCKAVLNRYRELSLKYIEAMNEATWIELQQSVLQVTSQLLGNSNPYALKHISTEIADELIELLLIIWIRSPHTKEEMWAEFSQQLIRLLAWKPLLVQWKVKMLQLTCVLREALYEGGAKKETSVIQAKKLAKLKEEWARTDKEQAEIPNEPAITTEFAWTPAKIRFMWDKLLHILGNINQITDPFNYTTAMSCVVEVIELLTMAQDSLPPNAPAVMPVYKIFLPWLLEGSRIDEKRNRGRLLASSCLCKLFCRRDIVYTANLSLLAYFYRMVQQSLSTNHSSVKWNIIRNSSEIFTLGLPGVNILIPHFLRELTALFTSKNAPPENVLLRSVSILASLICFPNHMRDVTIPYEGQQVTSDALRNQLSSILIDAFYSDVVAMPAVKTQLVYALLLVILDDLYSSNPRASIVQQCITALMETSQDTSDRVARASLDALDTLASAFPQLMAMGTEVVCPMVILLSNNIVNLIKDARSGNLREEIVVAHLYCLLNWVLIAGTNLLLDSQTVLDKVFSAVEYALLGEEVSPKLANFPAALAAGKDPNKDKSNKRKTRFLGMGMSRSSGPKAAQERILSIVESLNESPSHNSEKVRDAGETTAMALLSCFNNFPIPEGASEGPTVEEEDYQTQFFVLNNNIIISFSERDEDEDEAQQQARRAKRQLELEQLDDDGSSNSSSERALVMDASPSKVEHTSSLELDATADEVADDSPDGPDDTTDDAVATGTTGAATTTSTTTVTTTTASVANLSSTTLLVGQEAVDRVAKRKKRPFVRVTIRDSTGKYTWDCRSIYGQPAVSHLRRMASERERVLELLQTLEAELAARSPEEALEGNSPTSPAPAPPTQYSRSIGNPPLYWEGADYRSADMVQHLLSYLSETLPGRLHSGPALQINHPAKIDEMSVLLDKQYNTQETSRPLGDRVPLPMVPQVVLPDSYFHHCRLFLSHIGLLDEALRKNLLFLKFGKRLMRSIKELDKVNGREMIKIGLIYVRNGQEDQQEILANSLGTQEYTEFVSGLGWTIDVRTHRGYKGGLDERSTGNSAPYWADALTELIFHDITRMPTADDDPQQIHKKRHVGNDNVHVVWSNHKRDYSPTTITSQFNDAHIVVYPLPNGLFRIQIFKKAKIAPFGPLQDGMVVTKALLPVLVRKTAINANAAARAIQEVYKKPIPTRLSLIQQLVNRYKIDLPTEALLAGLFPHDGEYIAESPIERKTRGNSAKAPSDKRKPQTTKSSASSKVVDEKALVRPKADGKTAHRTPASAPKADAKSNKTDGPN